MFSFVNRLLDDLQLRRPVKQKTRKAGDRLYFMLDVTAARHLMVLLPRSMWMVALLGTG